MEVIYAFTSKTVFNFFYSYVAIVFVLNLFLLTLSFAYTHPIINSYSKNSKQFKRINKKHHRVTYLAAKRIKLLFLKLIGEWCFHGLYLYFFIAKVNKNIL